MEMGENKKLKIGIAFVLSTLILGVYAWLGDNDTMYLINEYISFDNSLFPNNLLREGAAVSSKYLSDMLSGMLFHLMSWSSVRLICYLFTVSILSAAFINFSLRFKMNYTIVSTAILAVLSLQEVAGNLAYYTTNIGGGNYERLAAAIGVLAISFCFGKEKWNTALILTACASVLHIHEGMYAFSFVMLLWIVNSIYNKQFQVKEIAAGFIICLAVILISAVPALLTNETIYTSKEYMDHFIWKRLANHIMPFKWGNFAISRQYAILLTMLCFSIVFLKENIHHTQKILFAYALAAILTMSAVILLSIVFIDIVPVRFFANLFMAKYIKYCEFYFLVLIVYTLDHMLCRIEFRFCALGLILLLPVTEWVMAALLPVTVLYVVWNGFYGNKKEKTASDKKSFSILSKFVLMTGVCVFVYFYLKNNQIVLSYPMKNAVYWGILLLSGAGMEYFLHADILAKKQLAVIMAGVLLLDAAYFASRLTYNRTDRSLAFKNSQFWIEAAASKDIYDLAVYFNQNSNTDALVLADPKDFSHDCAASWFQCLALRDVYVTDKVIVYTDAGIKEWNARLEKLAKWDAFTADDFYHVMKETGSGYILLDAEDRQKIHNSMRFQCVADTASYALYQIQ